MIRIVVEVLLLLGVVLGILYLAKQIDRSRKPDLAIEAPPDAMWRAVHHGTADERTEVQVVLRQGPNQIWDRRTVGSVDNADPNYDRLLFNAMEDARVRAELLNRMREPN